MDEGELNYIEGHSDASRKLYEYVRLVAPTNMSVLLEGASGTGKEHVARLIHLRSNGRANPSWRSIAALCRVNWPLRSFSAISKAPSRERCPIRRRFRIGAGRYAFLDEVGNLSYEVQIQLLRAFRSAE